MSLLAPAPTKLSVPRVTCSCLKSGGCNRISALFPKHGSRYLSPSGVSLFAEKPSKTRPQGIAGHHPLYHWIDPWQLPKVLTALQGLTVTHLPAFSRHFPSRKSGHTQASFTWITNPPARSWHRMVCSRTKDSAVRSARPRFLTVKSGSSSR